MTDHLTPADARLRSALPSLLVAILALFMAGSALWMGYSSSTSSTTPQQQAAVADPAIEQIKQTLSSVEQNLQAIQSAQEKLAAQVSDIQQKTSAQRGEQKLLSDQLGALSARVNALDSANAQSPATPQQTQPATPKPRRSKQ